MKEHRPNIVPPPSKRRIISEDDGEGSHRDRWMISYADLVTLLFSFFVVLYAAGDHERARVIQEALVGQISQTPVAGKGVLPAGNGVLPVADAVAETRTGLEKMLTSNEALRVRARVTIVERGFVISLTEGGFFPPGEATVRDDALPLLDAMADRLSEPNTTIRVEGHTDSVPISTARYPSNWELSSARASMVLARLVSRGIAPARLSVAGYASERPMANNGTPEGRALNRRVDLVVLQKGN
jgi:chemotaxis protein MotB